MTQSVRTRVGTLVHTNECQRFCIEYLDCMNYVLNLFWNVRVGRVDASGAGHSTGFFSIDPTKIDFKDFSDDVDEKGD